MTRFYYVVAMKDFGSESSIKDFSHFESQIRCLATPFNGRDVWTEGDPLTGKRWVGVTFESKELADQFKNLATSQLDSSIRIEYQERETKT